MKIRQPTSIGDEKVEIPMTPMIDIVFQLLVFFLFTFRIASQEGDFNIRMPLAAPREGIPQDEELLPLRVRLRASADGRLAGIALNDQPFDSFANLNNYVIGYLGDDRGPGTAQASAEVELDCDYGLRYEYVVQAITSVSGYRDESTGQIVKLVEKIKFSPPKMEEVN